jgi:hypothetical protein
MVFVLLLVVLLAVGGYIYLKSNKKKTTTSSSTTTSIANMVNTWTGKGTSDKFSDGANWSMGVPTNGQKLEINLSNVVAPSTTSATGSSTTAVVASSTPTILNDIASLSVKELKIDGSAKVTSLSITGKTLGLSGDLSINPTSTSGIKVGLNLPITLGADSTFSVGGANDVTVSGDTTSIFALGSYKLNLSVSNTANLNFLMPLSGTGSLIFAANSVSLAANAYFQAVSPSFNGKVEIGNNDVVVLGNSGATGAFGSAAITVNNGGSLELQSTTPTYALSNPLFLSGNGVNNSSANALGATTGALTGCITAGLGKCNPGLVVTLSGLVTLNANTQVGAVFLPSAGAKITGNSVSYHFANLVKNNFTVTTVANSQALIN